MAIEYDNIAKELTLSLIEHKGLTRTEWPDAETTADLETQL